MIKIGGKLPAKFAIKFALFFIVIAALAYFYFTNSFENEAIEKFRYKAEVFSNYLEQNPHIFWMKKQIDDRDQIIKLMELNDAVYLVLEDKEGSVFDAFNIKEAENNFYITTRNNEGISQDHKIFRISLPIVANRMNVGKIYVGFYAFDIITNLYKKELLTALLSLSILLLGIIISFYLASISFKPLTKISSTLDQRIKGGKNVKIDYREKDEFGLLAEKINSVMNELDISSDRVESLNRKLKNVFRDKIHEMEFEINQKQIALASLRTSEEQFRLLFENAPIGMVIVLPDMKIKSANKSFCNTLGYELDELIGLRLEILFSRRRVGDSIWENYEPDEKLMNLCSKQVLMKKDNSIIRVIAKYDVAHDNYNQPKHYIIQVSDITELLRVQNELEIALEKANESSRLKDAFLAQMSHEIRTPLNVILNSVPILADEVGEKDEDIQIIIDSVGSAGKRLQRTIDMILNMSAVQSRNFKADFKTVNLVEELRNLVTEFRPLSDDKGLDLLFSSSTKDPMIMLDKYTVIQIFQNIIDNAIKYTKKGFVRIVIEDDRYNRLLVLVEDSGIGMSQEYIKDIFVPFSQEDIGRRREYEGNGLGLALAKKYCEINNATLKVESKKNTGSVFTVVFSRESNNENLNQQEKESVYNNH